MRKALLQIKMAQYAELKRNQLELLAEHSGQVAYHEICNIIHLELKLARLWKEIEPWVEEYEDDIRQLTIT